VARRNPELIERRRTIGTKSRDKIWNLLFWPLMVACPVVAGLGVRYRWGSMPDPLIAAGVVLFAAGLGLSAWAMAVTYPCPG
jgi:hypothetical protein